MTFRVTLPKRITPGDGDPRHGTRNGYDHLGCRGKCCSRAKKAYESRRGCRPLVDVTEVREHVAVLKTVGSLAAIAEAAELPIHSLKNALIPSRKRIAKTTADQILGVTFGDVLGINSPTKFIAAAPSRAIAAELVAAGWSKQWIAQQVGHTGESVGLFKQTRWVHASAAKALKQLHDELWMANATPHIYRSMPNKDQVKPLRKVCKCMGVVDPEVLANRAAKRAERAKANAA